MKKLMAVITARPSYSRVRNFLLLVNADPDFELLIVLANSAIVSNYGDLRNQIVDDGFILHAEVSNMLIPNGIVTVPKSTALMMYELSDIFYKEMPNAVITIADRYETIATSIASAYLNIPLIHIQGGEITGNIDEKTRHANTKLADFHLACSEAAKNRILAMGESAECVFNCGCPSIDLAKEAIQDEYSVKKVLKRYNGIGNIDFSCLDNYVVVLQHPESEHPEESEEQIFLTLNILKELACQVFVFWPNSDAGTDGTSRGIRRFRENNKNAKYFYFKNFQPEDFIRLVNKANFLIGNSSVGIREASYLRVPVINLGVRQSNRDRGGNVYDCDFHADQIKEAIEDIQNRSKANIPSNYLYGTGDASLKMLRALRQFDYRYSKVNRWDV